MKVHVNAVNFNVDKKLEDFIQVRLDKLEKYYDKVVSADVFLKVENTSEKENKIAHTLFAPRQNIRLYVMAIPSFQKSYPEFPSFRKTGRSGLWLTWQW